MDCFYTSASENKGKDRYDRSFERTEQMKFPKTWIFPWKFRWNALLLGELWREALLWITVIFLNFRTTAIGSKQHPTNSTARCNVTQILQILWSSKGAFVFQISWVGEKSLSLVFETFKFTNKNRLMNHSLQ